MPNDLQHLDAAGILEADLAAVTSLADFCAEWKDKWRGVAVAAQSVLGIFFPSGAKVLGILISIADSFCANQP